MASALLEKRRARQEEKRERNPVEEKIKELLHDIRPEMFVDIKDLEETLVEYGRDIWNSKNFRLKQEYSLFQKLAAIELGPRDNVMVGLDNRFIIDISSKEKTHISSVIPTPKYIEEEIVPYLASRDILARVTHEDREWCSVALRIEGDD